MAASNHVMVLLALALAVLAVCRAQRPFYAGRKPIGYPQITEQEGNGLQNRFGVDDQLPVEARGDRNLVNRLDRLPVDQQPFWYLNWRQYEDFKRNPQAWPLKPNDFGGLRNIQRF